MANIIKDIPVKPATKRPPPEKEPASSLGDTLRDLTKKSKDERKTAPRNLEAIAYITDLLKEEAKQGKTTFSIFSTCILNGKYSYDEEDILIIMRYFESQRINVSIVQQSVSQYLRGVSSSMTLYFSW